jgi:cathepsin E
LSYTGTFHVDTLSPNNDSTIPTVTDNLFASGAIPEHLVAVFFPPFNNASSDPKLDVPDGELTWGLCLYHLKSEPDSEKFTGGTDASRISGNIIFT